MKLILRFFSINYFKTSCLDAEREYIEPTRIEHSLSSWFGSYKNNKK